MCCLVEVRLKCKGPRDQVIICSWSLVVKARNTGEDVYSMFDCPHEEFVTF